MTLYMIYRDGLYILETNGLSYFRAETIEECQRWASQRGYYIA